MSHHFLRQSFPATPRPLGMSAKTQAGTHLASGRCRWPLRGAEVGSSGPAGCVCSSGYQHRTYTSQPRVGSAEWWQGSPGDGNTLQRRRRVGIEPERSSQSSIQKYIHESMHPLIHPSSHASVNPSVHPFIYPTIYLTIQPYIHKSMHPLIHPSSCDPWIHPYIHSSCHLTIHPWIHACILPSIQASSIHPFM